MELDKLVPLHMCSDDQFSFLSKTGNTVGHLLVLKWQQALDFENEIRRQAETFRVDLCFSFHFYTLQFSRDCRKFSLESSATEHPNAFYFN